QHTARRLARAKADAAAASWPDAWVIGSDQVADRDGQPIGKPGTLENARAQLRAMSGALVLFHTAVCLRCAARERVSERLVTTEVRFRTLSEAEIERYLAREPALDCAGSAKSEGLGITLLERLSGDDPTALVGLPLIALSEMLRAEGFDLP
ncbi:MAG: Maf family protein, partial [Bacillota bacterium]